MPDDQRPGMSDIILRVRSLIGDLPGDIFTDSEVTGVIENHALLVEYVTLTPLLRIESGQSVYREFLTPHPRSWNWWSTAEFIDGDNAAINPDESNWSHGRWLWTNPPKQPIKIRGYTHDIYGAAADLLEERAGMIADEFSFGAEGDSYQRDARVLNMESVARRYRAKQRTTTTQMVRSDTT